MSFPLQMDLMTPFSGRRWLSENPLQSKAEKIAAPTAQLGEERARLRGEQDRNAALTLELAEGRNKLATEAATSAALRQELMIEKAESAALRQKLDDETKAFMQELKSEWKKKEELWEKYTLEIVVMKEGIMEIKTKLARVEDQLKTKEAVEAAEVARVC
jgi:hypothetical protein